MHRMKLFRTSGKISSTMKSNRHDTRLLRGPERQEDTSLIALGKIGERSSKKSTRFEEKSRQTDGRKEERRLPRDRVPREPVPREPVPRDLVWRASLSLEKSSSTQSGCLCPARLETSARKPFTSLSQRFIMSSFSCLLISPWQRLYPFFS